MVRRSTRISAQRRIDYEAMHNDGAIVELHQVQVPEDSLESDDEDVDIYQNNPPTFHRRRIVSDSDTDDDCVPTPTKFNQRPVARSVFHIISDSDTDDDCVPTPTKVQSQSVSDGDSDDDPMDLDYESDSSDDTEADHIVVNGKCVDPITDTQLDDLRSADNMVQGWNFDIQLDFSKMWNVLTTESLDAMRGINLHPNNIVHFIRQHFPKWLQFGYQDAPNLNDINMVHSALAFQHTRYQYQTKFKANCDMCGLKRVMSVHIMCEQGNRSHVHNVSAGCFCAFKFFTLCHFMDLLKVPNLDRTTFITMFLSKVYVETLAFHPY